MSLSNPPPGSADDGNDDGRDNAPLDWDQFLNAQTIRPRPAPPAAPASATAASAAVPAASETGAPTTRREARELERASGSAGDSSSAGESASGTPALGEPALSGLQDEPLPATHSAGRASRRAAVPGYPVREKRPRRGAWGCLIVLVVFIALMVAGFFAIQGPLASLMGPGDSNDYEGSGTGEVTVMIHEGDIGETIAQTLVDAGVTKSFDAFYDLLIAQTDEPVFVPGAYQLAEKMSAASALDALLDPANRMEDTVVIPEGTAAVVALENISEGAGVPLADLQAAAADYGSYGLPSEATSIEGFLFPATYTFAPGATAHDIVRTLVDRMFQALDSAGVAPEDRYRVVVFASLVQREAGLRDDYYKVARVFQNRLDQGMLLQSDATVAYGTGNTHRVETSDAERADATNPYNTYVHPGLPVGPISNPGDLAIDAVLHPADGPWLYFVTWNLDTGETIFSETLQEHEAAVEKWQAWMADHPEYG